MKLLKLLPGILILVILLASCSTKPAESLTAAPTLLPTQPPAAQLPINPTDTIAPTPTFEPITLKMNSSRLTSYGPIYIALAEGFFAEYGITMEFVDFKSPADAVPLVESGELDIYGGGFNSGLLNVMAQGGTLRLVVDRGHIAPDDACTYLGLLVRKDLFDSGAITKPEDLKGKKVVVSVIGVPGYFLSTYLAQANLSINDIEAISLPNAAYQDAIENKSVDALTIMEPDISRFTSIDDGVLVASADQLVGPLPLSNLGFAKKLRFDHPDWGARFLAAYLKGVHQYNEGKTDRNIEIIAAATQMDPEVLKNSCWPSINDNGIVNFDGMEAYQQWAIAQDLMEFSVPQENIWDPAPLAAALKLLNP